MTLPDDPGPEDVAQALRDGVAPTDLVDDDPAPVARPRAAPALSEAPVVGGGLAVRTRGGSLLDARDRVLQQAAADDLAGALTRRDPTLWGPEAAAEALVRLGWLDAVRTSRALVPDLVRLREELAGEGVDRVVLVGTGGSSLAPEVVCAADGRPLVVLDSLDPGEVAAALTELERTVVVVSSGGGVETDSLHRAARAALEAAGLDPAARLVVVAEPGSPPAEEAEREGSRAVVLTEPGVRGSYAALTATGLVPSALAGVDVAGLLEQAAVLEPTLADPSGPALALGAVLGGAAVGGRDKLVVADLGPGLGAWVEQLVAASTGGPGRGVLPVLVEGPDAPGTEPAADVHLLVLDGEPPGQGTAVQGPLGAQLLAWQFAAAVAARVLGVDPFHQPDVEGGEDRTLAARGAGPDGPVPPVLVEGAVELHGAGDLLAGAADLAGALDALLAAVPDRGYLAVTAHLDRHRDGGVADLRAALARRIAHPVTFGWGPRVRHAAGQLHRGGPATGAFLQITGEVRDDVEVPGRPYTFGHLQAAQAAEDLAALSDLQRPVLRLHLTDRAAGLAQILEAVRR